MLRKKGLRKKLLCFAILLSATTYSHSQTLADTIRNEIASINHVFDSAFYLTFDVKVTYHSDTLWANTDSADFNHSEMTGTYTFHRNNALYKLGNIEFMQNDSFTIALYKDEKFILVGKPSPNNGAANFLPNKAMLDSMLTQLDEQFVFGITSNDSVKTITLIALDTLAVYRKITIEYDRATFYLLNIKCEINEHDYDEIDELESLPSFAAIRKAVLGFEFKDYRVGEIGSSVFSEARYLFFDGPNDIQPADAYKNYTIYKNY